MRRTIAMLAVTVVGVILILTFRSHPETPTAVPPATDRTGRTGASSGAAAPSATAPLTRALPRGHHVVTGDAEQTQWGIVQVRVTVDARRIVDVRALRLPNSNPLDVQLSGRAVRVLRPAVLAAQSADVDMVSQATVTSDGYLRSLQSALDELHA
jgi:uncharacterized protein with FMN-binding domain